MVPLLLGALVDGARASGLLGYGVAVQRRALGALFGVIALALVALAIYSALEGGRALVVALASAALAAWMADLARRALRG